MNVVHVVSGLAPDQRFGGISRVALDLARAQMLLGHRVHILSTAIGFDRPLPRTIEGVPVTLLRSLHPFPSLGYGTVVSPGLPLAVLRLLRRADLLHVHLAREPNTLGAALLAVIQRVPVVVQTHGMLDAPSNRLAALVDRTMTSPVLRRTHVALTLTPEEDTEVARLSRGALQPSRFPNGVPLPEVAKSLTARRSVLFLSRLHPRKGAVQFAEAAVLVAPTRSDLTFDLIGPDEGDAAAVRAAIDAAGVDGVVLHGPIPHADVAERMRSAVLYCLPAHREPFGLTVLEALASGTPVLLHESAELAPVVVETGAGWTFGAEEPLPAVLARVLAGADELAQRGTNARRLVEQRYGLASVVDRLESVYRSVLDNAGGGPTQRRRAR